MRTSLESEPQPGVDAPLFVDVAAEAARHFTVEVARFADPDVTAQTQLEPGIAVVIVFGQDIIRTTCVRSQLQIALTCKFVQQVGFQLDIAAVFYLLSHHEADTADGAVHAFDITVGAPIGGVVDAAQSAKGKLDVRLDEQPALHIKAFAVFDTDAVGVLLIFGLVGEVAVGFQVGSYDAVAGRDIGIGAVVTSPDPVQAEGLQLVFTAARFVTACAVAVVYRQAVDALGVY